MKIDLHEVFERYAEDYLKFEQIQEQLSKRPDLHAFILLDRICPGATDLISAATHDEYFLSIECEALASKANEDQIRDLVRCGVRYDQEYDSLAMFT